MNENDTDTEWKEWTGVIIFLAIIVIIAVLISGGSPDPTGGCLAPGGPYSNC